MWSRSCSIRQATRCISAAPRFPGRATPSPAARARFRRGLPLYRHYGLYAYRVGFLRQYPALAPAPIERFEALEQLRALWYGYRIIVRVTRGAPAPGVDTAEDLERVRSLYAQRRV